MISKFLLLTAFLTYNPTAFAADSRLGPGAPPTPPTEKSAKAGVAASRTKTGDEHYIGKSIGFSAAGGQTLDIQALLSLPSPISVNNLTLVTSSPSQSWVEVYFRGNRIYQYGPAPDLLTTLAVPVFENVVNSNELTVTFTGAFTLASLGVTYQDVVLPPPPPPPPISICTLSGYGTFGNNLYYYRINRDGVTIDGTDGFDDLLQRLNGWMNQGACRLASPQTAVCTMQGAGLYRGLPWLYRIKIDDAVFDATTDQDPNIAFNTFKNRFNTLRNWNICKVQGSDVCQLLSSGVYNGRTYAHRVAIGSDVVDASDDLDTAAQRVRALVELALCR